MGLFDFGGSKTRSQSTSRSSSFDNLDSSAFNFGVDASSSVAGSQGRTSSRVAFEDVFAQLFGGASGAAGAINTGALTETANMLFSGGSSFLAGLQDGGAGANFLEDRLASRDGLADEQIGLLGDDISRFLAEDVNPAITSGGVAAGTLGGSRGEVQRGIASRGATEAFARGATDIRANEQAARDLIAQMLAGDETNRFTQGIGALPGLFGLAESGQFAGLSPFAALSQILGGPTVLTDSESSSSSLAESLGLNVGGSQSTGRAGSQSSSDSTSKTDSFSFGF